MIPRSPLMAVCALFAALAAHAALLVDTEPLVVETEGGGSTAPAALGNSFADFTQGTLQPVAAEQSAVQSPPPVQPTVTPPVPAAVSPVAAPPVAALTPVATPQPAKPVRPAQTAALVDPPSEQAPEATKRPPQRPEPAKPAPRGNSARNATSGIETGAEEQRAKSAPSTQTATASDAGNEAASNYPGLVTRQIFRQRKPRTSVKGVVHVSFAIDASGGLASVRIAQSSGSAELDDLALRQIRQAAPFPPPPSGARRQYTIAIKGR